MQQKKHNFHLPPGPYRLPISPFGRANFKACTHLCPLYMIRWCSSGRAIGRDPIVL